MSSETTRVGSLQQRVGGLFGRLYWCCNNAAYEWVKLSFAFVFFWFGAQKVPVLIHAASPVRDDVAAFLEVFGFGSWLPISIAAGILLVGIYEMVLGSLFVLSLIEERISETSYLMYAIVPLFVIQQIGTFSPLVLLPEVVFQPTTMMFDLAMPFGLDWMSAFIFKNLIFIGAFALLFVQWHERYGIPPEN